MSFLKLVKEEVNPVKEFNLHKFYFTKISTSFSLTLFLERQILPIITINCRKSKHLRTTVQSCIK